MPAAASGSVVDIQAASTPSVLTVPNIDLQQFASMVTSLLQGPTDHLFGLRLPPSVSLSLSLPVEHHQSSVTNGFQLSLAGAVDMPATFTQPQASLHSDNVNNAASAVTQSCKESLKTSDASYHGIGTRTFSSDHIPEETP